MTRFDVIKVVLSGHMIRSFFIQALLYYLVKIELFQDPIVFRVGRFLPI